MKRKGISLIVLIITIVVIIILATAIIVNLAQTNLIKNSEEAVFKQDIQTYKDELSLYIADKFADAQGEYDANLLNADLNGITYNGEKVEGTIKNILSLSKKYEDKIIIVNGKLMVDKEKATEEEIEWFEEIGVDSIKKEEEKDDVENEEPKDEEIEEPEVSTKVELKDADNATKMSNRFGKDLVLTVYSQYIGVNSVTFENTTYTANDMCMNGNNPTGVIIYADYEYFNTNIDQSIIDSLGFKVGYYKCNASGSSTMNNLINTGNYWEYLGTSYLVDDVDEVELKYANDTTKVSNNFGENLQLTLGSNQYIIVSTVTVNDVVYTNNEMCTSDKYPTGAIIYADYEYFNTTGTSIDQTIIDNVGFKAGYYKCVATSNGSTNSLLNIGSAWEYLGTSYIVAEVE